VLARCLYDAPQGFSVPKILVADDNANIQKMVVLAFQDHGIQVVAVANGEAAVRRIPDFDPDLVLADIFMPVRNGYEVCEFVKKDDRFAHIPVILLVGAFDPLDEREARRVGADGVLKKPFIPPDPLIAMVMSALEKNPRVVAELAKAKEAKQAPAPDPVALPELPSRAEPKPLPHFPEPTAEEAAIVYGFGSGRRALDGEKVEPEVEEVDEATEDAPDTTFDSAATSRDWRRTAMDFEVSAEDAKRPAFSSIDDLDPITFPSERDVPPRHVRVTEPAGEPDSSLQDQDREAPQPEIAQSEPASVLSFTHSAAPPLATVVPVMSEPKAPTPEGVEAERSLQERPAVEADSRPEPSQLESSTQPRTAHWMDAVMPSHSDYPQRADWMSALSSPAPAETVSTVRIEEPQTTALVLVSPAPESFTAIREIQAGTQGDVRPVQTETVVEASSDSAGEASPEAMPKHVAEAAVETANETTQDAPWFSSVADRQEPFFTDEAIASPRTDSWFAPAPPVAENSHALESEVVSGAFQTDQNLETEPQDFAPSVAFKDPALVESPAVHVTPEPLLIEEEAEAPSLYGSHAGDIAPAHSFFAPPTEDPGETVEEPVAEQPSANEEAPVRQEAPAQPFRAWVGELNERIPTGPPPNREALAEIPFLTPPPDFHPEAAVTKSDAVNVDDLVRKILQKLEPQLHELLSQNFLKPIVENVVQDELTKKETAR
jgi:CheY-like chemotaxis protein